MRGLQRRRAACDLCMVLPALVVFSMVIWYPMVMSTVYSFTNFNGLNIDFDFVGLKNYFKVFDSGYVRSGILNTLKFALVSVVVCNVVQLALALVLDRKLLTNNYLRTAFYIPVLLSTVVVSAVFGRIMQYQGVLNSLFARLGMNGLVMDWFGNSSAAFIMVVLVNIWQWAGYGAMIYLGGLQTIPDELYESARIDGAKGFRLFAHITLPLLMPSVTVLTFLNLTGGLKMFDLPYTLTAGGPNNATETVCTVIYTTAFRQQKMGLASAIAVIFLIVIAVVSIVQVTLTRRREVEV